MHLILSEEPSTEERNVPLELPVVGVRTLVDVLRREVFPSSNFSSLFSIITLGSLCFVLFGALSHGFVFTLIK